MSYSGVAGLEQHGQDEMLADVRRCSSFCLITAEAAIYNLSGVRRRTEGDTG